MKWLLCIFSGSLITNLASFLFKTKWRSQKGGSIFLIWNDFCETYFFNAFGTADNKSGINVVKNKTAEPLRWVDFLNVRTMLLKMIFFYVFGAADNKSIISLAQNKKELTHPKGSAILLKANHTPSSLLGAPKIFKKWFWGRSCGIKKKEPTLRLRHLTFNKTDARFVIGGPKNIKDIIFEEIMRNSKKMSHPNGYANLILPKLS